MKLSIVIATYNSQATLSQCLESILEQQGEVDFEIIIKDGGSTDRTLSIIDEYGSKVKVISSSDTGVYNAWNEALRYTSGDWVTFLGSDDYLSSNDVLLKVQARIEDAKSKGFSLIYGKNNIISVDEKIIQEVGIVWDVAKLSLNKRMTIRHPGCFCKRDLITKVGGFDESFSIIGDYDFVLSAKKFTDFGFYDFVSVNHRVGGLSISPSKMFLVIKETYKLRKKHSIKPRVILDALFFKRLTLFFMSLVLSDAVILKIVGKIKRLTE